MCSIVSLIGRHTVKAGVRAAAIVAIEVPPDRGTCVWHAVVGVQVDLLVFHAAPQPFDEHVVPPGAFAVHADGDAVPGEHTGEGLARELAALIGIEDHGLAVFCQSILQRLDTEHRLHRDRYAPRQYTPG